VILVLKDSPGQLGEKLFWESNQGQVLPWNQQSHPRVLTAWRGPWMASPQYPCSGEDDV